MAGNKSDGTPRGLKAIAELAGVSPATVSRVINNRPGVRQEMRQLVEQVIRQYGLQVDVSARALKTRKTDKLAIIVPRDGSLVFANPYYTEIFRGLSSVVETMGYTLSVMTGATSETLHEVNRNRSCDAVLFVGFRKNIPDPRSLRGAVVPVVTIPRPGPRYKLPYVSMDDEAGTYEATKYLLDLGHTRIGLIAGFSTSIFSITRTPGFKRAFNEADLPFPQALVVDGQYTYEGAYEVTKELLERKPRPTAILAFSDLMALGALNAVLDKGLSVPGDVALVGFGNTPISSYVTPKLTTVEEHLYELGVQAASLLIALARGEEVSETQIVLPTSLVIREST